ncbi:hypothetical protein C0991_002098 [Blastosporella zonata]|nr:hypothetical protein C0991_002098 [Blastosporella zonata]
MFILHFGSPRLVNYKEPIFQCVTHLYTSTLDGYRETHITDLPQLTHLAAHTRLDQPIENILSIAAQFLRMLERSPQLKLFVFTLDDTYIAGEKVEEWNTALQQCIQDSRFVILPRFRQPRMEWEGLLRDQPNVWERALAWRTVMKEDDAEKITRYRIETLQSLRAEKTWMTWKKLQANWEIDMVQRDGYVPFEGDLTEQREAVVLL